MKKFEIDRCAYYWSCKLLPDHIEKLKEEAKNAEEYEAIYINNEIERAAEELEEIQKKYDELRNRGIKK